LGIEGERIAQFSTMARAEKSMLNGEVLSINEVSKMGWM
jgi:hypothetical protein